MYMLQEKTEGLKIQKIPIAKKDFDNVKYPKTLIIAMVESVNHQDYNKLGSKWKPFSPYTWKHLEQRFTFLLHQDQTILHIICLFSCFYPYQI